MCGSKLLFLQNYFRPSIYPMTLDSQYLNPCCACVRGVILWVVLSRYTYRSVLVVAEFGDVVGSVLLELMKWSSRLHLGI